MEALSKVNKKGFKQKEKNYPTNFILRENQEWM